MSNLEFHLYHVAGVNRRQLKNITKLSRKCQILEFRDNIWNHHEEYIQISTNMPGIGSIIREIDVYISEVYESQMSIKSNHPLFPFICRTAMVTVHTAVELLREICTG